MRSRLFAPIGVATTVLVTASLLSPIAVNAADEAAVLRFDFGVANSPVELGYLGVTNTTSYTAERGYGVVPAAGVTLISRNRVADGTTVAVDAVKNDFVAGTPWQFLADVPNGIYDVTVISGDQLAGTSRTKTDISLEDTAAGQLSSLRETTSATWRTTVSDGQLTVGVAGNGYVNGIVVQPVVEGALAAPTGLALARVTHAEVAITWQAVEGAAGYKVYRGITPEAAASAAAAAAAVSEAKAVEATAQALLDIAPQLIGETDATEFSDSAVTVGESYDYAVTSLSASGIESALSAPALSSGQVPELEAPDAPADVAVRGVTQTAVELGWTAVPNATRYRIERAELADGEFAVLGETEAPAFSDGTADTSKPGFYRVIAINEAGESAASSVVASGSYDAPASLPELNAGQSLTFDFGPGAAAEGALPVQAQTIYNPDWKYGFSAGSPSGVDRGTSDPLRSDFVAASGATFVADLGAGDYTIDIIAGDAQQPTAIAISAESIPKVLNTSKLAGEFLEMSFALALVDGQLTLDFAGDAASINAITVTRQASRTAGAEPTVFIAGDSTVQSYDAGYVPQAGWGQMIPRFFGDDVTFANHAIGGRSSKNFISQGRLDEVLRAVKPGDYLMVQFGHNDATQGVDDRYASPADYKEYLRVYVDGVRQRGATPILVTPVSRRSFNAATGEFNVSFGEYVAKMAELAAEEGVLLVDLSASSRAYLNEVGPEVAKSVFLHVDAGVYPGRPAGTIDDTHFQEYGAIQMARLIAQDVALLDDPLAASVADVEPPADLPAAPTGLIAGSISNAGAVLQWAETPGADIYRIYRKEAAQPNTAYALVGTSTVATATVQGLQEGVAYSYRIGAVNGLGESEPSEAVSFATKSAKYKFDFQPAGAPVASGYTEVHRGMGYNAERGFGFTDTGILADRDRGASAGGPNELQRDFVLSANPFEFVLDVPNGSYSVKSYSGDWIGSSKTTFTIEGRDFGSGNAGKASVAEGVRGPVLVTDGQLNVVVGGTSSRLNGLEITPILLGPTGLEVSDVDASAEPPTVSLQWDGQHTMSYRVYRQAQSEATASVIGVSDSPRFTDATARVGLDYEYFVTAVDPTSLESVPSTRVKVALSDSSVAAPVKPTGLTLGEVTKNAVALSWESSADARYYLVTRSEKRDGDFVQVGIAESAQFTDTSVLTTIEYFYKVVAVNAGGRSAASAVLGSPAVTVLQRQAEYLDRAPVAVPHADGGALVSWRMLGLDPESIAFNVYRDGVKLNAKPIADSTNYLDAAATADAKYTITRVLNGAEVTEAEGFGVLPNNYLSVALNKPADDYTKDGQLYSYSAGDASVGDLDGDGEYEIVQMWSPSNSKDNSQAGYTGLVYIDAYRLDGTQLWRINMGQNIRAGAHYTQLQVFDLDGDGKAEVTVKTADGTIDGAGTVIGNGAADYRNSSGYVLTGPEFLSVFDGLTGAVRDTIAYTPERGDVGAWGDGYGNRVDRFLAGIAYLDGEHPSVLFSRGYYTRAVVAAYDFVGGKLVQRWVFDTKDDNNAAGYGQGNHNLSTADVDGDGKDEIVFGSATIDDDGSLLYSTGLGHGDALHVSDLIPDRAGLEVFAAHEDMGSSGNLGATMRDAATGEILWSIPATRDTGRAAAGDIDARYPGAESWAIGGDASWNSPVGQLMSASGELISEKIPAANFVAWWDGDPLREIVDHSWNTTTLQGVPTISKWNPETESVDELLRDENARSGNGTKGTPAIQADLLGDWREEIAWRSADSSELRIYTTSDETELRLRTLMHDPVYRNSVAWQNTSYNQPTQTSYFLGDGMTMPAAPNIYYTAAPETETDATAPVIAGLPPRLIADSAALVVEVTADDPESGVRNLDITFDGQPVAVGDRVDLRGLVGQRAFTVRAVNNAGLVSEESFEITVFADDGAKKAPGRGALSSNSGWANGLSDGNFTVSMNLWWGQNGSVFRLYENGELISSQAINSNTPAAQLVKVGVSGRANGTYVYTGELVNAAGTTETSSVTVDVKHASPGVPVLSHNNWDGDGDFTVTSNLWWGTNATAYRLFEDGVLVDEQSLIDNSPAAQRASTALVGRASGDHIYVVEFANAAGTVSSAPLTVRVR